MAVVINGSGTVTGLAVGGLPDGTVDAGTLADDAVGLAQMASGTDGNLITYDASGDPAAVAVGTSGQVLTSNGAGSAPTMQAGGGVTECDQWRLTTDFQGNATPIASNLERNDCNSFGLLGTGMSQSSGIFTFPSTGYWLVRYQVLAGTNYSSGAETQGCWGHIQTTVDNSTYVSVASAQQGTKNFNNSYHSGINTYCEALIDVTNTTNVKVRFSFGAGQGGEWCRGSSTAQQTGMTFLRLGDT